MMCTIKDRNGINLKESEDIKRWQEYTEELYKKDLHDQDNHDGVITLLEPGRYEWNHGTVSLLYLASLKALFIYLFLYLKTKCN